MGNFYSSNSTSSDDISIGNYTFIDELITDIGAPTSIKDHKTKGDTQVYKWDEIRIDVRKSDRLILCVYPIG